MRLPPTLTCQKCNKKMTCIDAPLTIDQFEFGVDSIVSYLQMGCPGCKYTCEMWVDEDHISTMIKEYYKDGGREKGEDPVYLQD